VEEGAIVETWYTEHQASGIRYSMQIEDMLYSGKSDFQEIQVYETVAWGRVMVIDGYTMTTDKDEFIYHEMLTHVPLMSHKNPEKVLIIGGGDGGILREVVKHPSVKLAHLVEIDEKVIEVSKKYFPQIACGFDSPKAKVDIADGIAYIKSIENEYDVIIIDSTDPVGPAVGLFSHDFYAGAARALKPDGIFAAQTESWMFNTELIKTIASTLKVFFKEYKPYIATIPTYPSAAWCFSIASQKNVGEIHDERRYQALDTRYYTPAIHKASFALPRFFEQALETPGTGHFHFHDPRPK
jgi:spermidine synthase